jgi:CRP/FNR family cyclic AMP-dependent transcriptional regulator
MRLGNELNASCRHRQRRGGGFFCQLPETARRDFDSIKVTSRYPRGAILHREGEEPQGVCVLCEGRAKLSLSSSRGRTLSLRIAAPGEVLGLYAAISGRPYETTAEVLHLCEVDFVRRNDFLHFLHAHPEAFASAMEILSRDYHAACGKIRALGLGGSVVERLASFLLEWDQNGPGPGPGGQVKLALTHEEIGQLIGASRETVSRAFSALRQRRLVEQRGATLVIQNRTALESIGEGY